VVGAPALAALGGTIEVAIEQDRLDPRRLPARA